MKIGFIGFGHMASAIAKGLIRAEYVEPRDIYACASDFDGLKERTAQLGIRALRDNSEVAQEASIVFISVKPSQVEEVIARIKDDIMGRIVISVAFGLDFDYYEGILNPGTKHISVIPNTPVEVCQGMTICQDKHNLSEPELEIVKVLLKTLGEIEFMPGETMWLAGEIASCGPAFAAMFIEALGDAGAKYGLEKEAAYKIAAQMVAGTGRLQVETGKSPGEMADEVATPGGVTIKGVKALKKADFHDVVAKAIDAIEKI